MGTWFKKRKTNGLTITTSSKGTTWSKSTKGGSVRHTTTHKPNGKIIQTTTQRSPGGFVKIEKKTLNKTPRLPQKPRMVKLPNSNRIRHTRKAVNVPTSFFGWCCLLVVIMLMFSCQR